MGKVSLQLDFNVDGADEKVKAFVSSLESISKTSAGIKGPPASSTDALDKLRKTFATSGAEADKFKKTLSGVTDTLRQTASSTLGASGFGGALSGIVGVTSIGAAVAAVGAIVGMSMKMAYEFEKSSARAAAALSIGFGGNLASNMKTVQAAAYTGERYGFNVQEMVAAMEQYGRSSGATVQQAAGAAQSMAVYARAYGLEPGRLGAMVGSFQAASGGRGDFDSNAGALFGGAERAGSLGRRIDEFVSASTSVLQTMMYSQSGSTFDPARAAGFAASIAKDGGIYATAGGIQGVMGAGQALVSGGNQDIRKTSFMLRAGMSSRDIILGNTGNTGENIRKMQSELTKEYGPANTDTWLMGLQGLGLSQDQMRLMAGLPAAQQRALQFPKAGAPTRLGTADQFANTPAGLLAHGMATLSNTMTADGEKGLQAANAMYQAWKDGTGAMGNLRTSIDRLNDTIGGTVTAAQHGFEAKPGSDALSYRGANPIQAWQMATMQSKTGMSAAEARSWANIGASPEDAATMHAIMMGESGGANIMNAKGGPAGGTFQMIPTTAATYVPAAWQAKYGATTTARGWRNFMGSPKIQQSAALAYWKHLESVAWSKGLRGDAFLKASAEGYYGGEGAMGHDDWKGEFPGDPTVGQYGDDYVARYHAMESAQVSAHGVTAHITLKPNKKAPHNGPLAKTKPKHQ